MLIIGGGIVGCETALYLAQDSDRGVSIVESERNLASDMFVTARLVIFKLLSEANVKIITEVNVLEITDGGAPIKDRNNKKNSLLADTIVVVVGFLSDDKGLVRALRDQVPEIYSIGDCVTPRKVINAVWEGFHTARMI